MNPSINDLSALIHINAVRRGQYKRDMYDDYYPVIEKLEEETMELEVALCCDHKPTMDIKELYMMQTSDEEYCKLYKEHIAGTDIDEISDIASIAFSLAKEKGYDIIMGMFAKARYNMVRSDV